MALQRCSSVPKLSSDNVTNVFLEKSSGTQFMTLDNKIRGVIEHKQSKVFNGKNNRGFVRLYRPSGYHHITVPVVISSTVQEVCETFNLDPLFLKIGNQHIKQLGKKDRLLQIQNDILTTLGYITITECLNVGGSGNMTHIFCFYTGRPQTSFYSGISNVLLIANCIVGKGRILQRWSKKRCILYNDTIRIENESSGSQSSEGDEDNIILLNKFKVELAESSHGRCLKLTSNTQKICFVFEKASDMQQWSAHVTQCSIVPNCDLSDQRLLFLPDKLFYVGSQRMIISLNLRRNSLLMKPSNTAGSPLIGWLDDVARFPSLRSLNLADNCLYTFPHAILQLTALLELNLAGNRISVLPSNIRLLKHLIVLNLSNNWLTSLPKSLTECQMIESFDLSFNRLQQVPEALQRLQKLTTWDLAGNYISQMVLEGNLRFDISKLDLRLNAFNRSLRLTSFVFISISVLDLRNAGCVTVLDLSNLSSVKVVYCAYLECRSLQINGSSLRELYAEHNRLSQLIVMPIPANLTILSIAHNKLEALPEWITDLSKIVTINAHHNRLVKLPSRIMMNISSLRHLFIGNNQLKKLPDIVENCAIEVLNVAGNLIEKLPVELFKAAHQLRHVNFSNNHLTELPSTNPYMELNRINSLRLAGNQLSESCMPVLVSCRKLKILDLSYNNFRFFNDSALSQLKFIEDLNVSGNRLISLSTELALLPNLQVLRVHSNKISAISDLSFSKSLKIVDLSNNRLANIKMEQCVAPHLKFLDLTCNPFCDSTKQLEIRSNNRVVSVVDISKRSILSNVQFGFSETAGHKSKQCTRQLRPANPCDIVFGIVDGGSNSEIADFVIGKLKHHLQGLSPTNTEDLRRALLRTHEDIGERGNRLGASAFLLQIEKGQIMCASSGHVSAILSRRNDETMYLLKEKSVLSKEEYERLRLTNGILTADNLINGVAISSTSIGYTFLYPSVVPNPISLKIDITNEDDFIVIANRVLWQSLMECEIIDAVRQCSNAVQAAKRLQDMCQAVEQTGNISIIVIKFIHAPQCFGNDLLTDSYSRKFTSFSQCSPISLTLNYFTHSSHQLRSQFEQHTQDPTFCNSENKIEKFSTAVNCMENDFSGVYYVNPPLPSSTLNSKHVSVRQLSDGCFFSKQKLDVGVPELSTKHDLHDYEPELIKECISPITSSLFTDLVSDLPKAKDTGNNENASMFSQERFLIARDRVQRELKLEMPRENSHNHFYFRRQ